MLGLALAVLGAALSVGLAGIGSVIGVSKSGQAGAGVVSEEPEKFGKVLLLQALPSTQGIYGFIGAFWVIIKLGLLGGEMPDITWQIGLAICYDLRFPELFRQLAVQGAEIIVLPAAFTAITGKAHWEVLLRARAIENLCYMVAAAQGGYHVNGRETHGDSMIVDPWGSILDHLPQGSGYVIADVDLENVKSIRTNFPALQHRKISCPLPSE